MLLVAALLFSALADISYPFGNASGNADRRPLRHRIQLVLSSLTGDGRLYLHQ